MHFLPKANPLYEKISVTKIVIPDVLEKLSKGGFTGYLNYSVSGFEAYCIFSSGKLLCAVSSEPGREKTGFEAIVYLFDKVFSAGGEINVYRMTSDLAMCAHALVVGVRLFKGDDVRQVDIKGILARLKAQELNGVVHFYTPERYAMMFYKNGLPIGFYHDGALSIESLPDESRKVAALPGAKIDVCTTKPMEELLNYDLLQMVNIHKLWEAAQLRSTSLRRKERLPMEADGVAPDDGKLAELVDDLLELGSAYLSKAGREIVERRLKDGGGSSLLLDSGKMANFLSQVASDAREVDSHARIDEMIELMKSEITGRLAS
ncbi:MAG: GTPase-activating protein [Geobacter sp.]|nr:GTPase-activating protein [Geobacter sp.]